METSSMTESERLSLHGTLHGTTSLFRLPSNTVVSSAVHDQVDRDIIANRESLLNNAWRERAFEKLADIPVGAIHRFLSW